MKRTALKRTAPLKIQSVRLKQRGKLPARSRKVQADLLRRRAEKDVVFEREPVCALVSLKPGHHCYGGPTPHHVLKASRGGKYDAANLTHLCAAGNTWVEDFPVEAESLGLSLPSTVPEKSRLLMEMEDA